MKISKLTITSIILIQLNFCGTSTAQIVEKIKITSGACGHLIMRERIDKGFESALDRLRADLKDGKIPCEAKNSPCRIETLELKTEQTDSTHYFAIKVMNNKNLMEGSVTTALSDKGGIYQIAWCAD